ncbi:hypothetical protein Tco_1366455 [Tanacetum coccineum]
MTISCHSLKGNWSSISGSIARGDLLNALNRVTKTLKAIQDAVKEDHILNKKVIEVTEAYTKNSTHLTELLILIKNFDFQGLKSSVESLQATALSQDKHLVDWAKYQIYDDKDLSGFQKSVFYPSSSVLQTTLDITRGPTNVRGENVTPTVTEEPPSHTEGEIEDTKKEQVFEEPKHAKIATDDVVSQVKLVPTSRVVQEDPDEPVRVPYMINGKMHYLTNDEITTHLEKEELIKKAAEQARLLAITKPEVVKVVGEEAEKIGINPERITSAKEGEKFKKARDAELKVLNKERNEKLKKPLEPRKHKYENYMLTIGNKLKPEKITDVKIHPHIKPIVVEVYKSTNRRTFEVHTLFSFGAFAWNSVSSSYPILEQASSKSLGRKRKHMELEPEIKVPRLYYDRSLPEGVPFVNNIVIKEHEYGIFFTDVFGGQAFQRWNYIHKVGVDSMVSYLVMALMIKTPENARFCLKLKKLIAEHPDQEKLKSKRLKLEALGYKLD